MTTVPSNPPAFDELEVSIFGPGYGEAIVIHFGGGNWMLVDSCSEPTSRQPAALAYLRAFNVDVASAVRLIVVTHWHDDHVQGIGELVDACPSARVAISEALGTREFLNLVGLYFDAPAITRGSMRELVRLYEILEERKANKTLVATPALALVDRLLWRDDLLIGSAPVPVQVHALSPSDSTVHLARLQFANLMSDEQSIGKAKLRIPAPSPNHVAVALWVEVGGHKVLLGADLENSADPTAGWGAVLTHCQAVSGKAILFKVPHHGSPTAYNSDVWSERVSENAVAMMTPYSRGKRPLPTREDLKRIRSHTRYGYITARPGRRQNRWDSRVVRQFVEGATKDIRDAYEGWGQICFRCPIANPNAEPSVEVFGDALHIGAN